MSNGPGEKCYIGDAVYAGMLHDGTIVLTTEDGKEISNTIYLEPEVYDSLLRWRESLNYTFKERFAHLTVWPTHVETRFDDNSTASEPRRNWLQMMEYIVMRGIDTLMIRVDNSED